MTDTDEITCLRAENERLRTRVRELEGQHKGLVLNNAILRERPDLPLNRIPAARAMTKLYEENERLRAALRDMLRLVEDDEDDPAPYLIDVVCDRARATLDGQPAPGKEGA